MRRLPLIAIALIAAAGTAWASGALVVPSRVEVGGGRVAIGDVVQGDLPKTVARAFLCKAPSLGSETSITGTFIAARVRQAGAGDLALALPERVTIVRSSQSVSAEKIRHAAEKRCATRRADARRRSRSSAASVTWTCRRATFGSRRGWTRNIRSAGWSFRSKFASASGLERRFASRRSSMFPSRSSRRATRSPKTRC
ncbi:MAG: hypothetical protein M5R36_29065 [Deltaproteobacteria bacterium]|nr:hypothetical protein [Deltaproteobacteria bacterium]